MPAKKGRKGTYQAEKLLFKRNGSVLPEIYIRRYREAIVAPRNLTASTFSNQSFNVKGSSGWALWAFLIEVGALS